MYPGCRRFIAASFYAPLLVLIGEEDDWTQAKYCRQLLAHPRAADEPELRVKVYPDATHSFDADAPERNYLGHLLRYDPIATADARAEIKPAVKPVAAPKRQARARHHNNYYGQPQPDYWGRPPAFASAGPSWSMGRW